MANPDESRPVLQFLRLIWPTVVESDDTPTRVRYLYKRVRQLLTAFPERGRYK